MDIEINCTADGTITYPLHSHTSYEVICYLSGEGHLLTNDTQYPFSPGTIIIVPPSVEHGSTSKNGFKNISINSEFNHLLNFKKPVVLYDNSKQEGRVLAKLLYENRFGSFDFISSLSETYVLFLLSNLKTDNSVENAVTMIISEITDHAYDSTYDIGLTLRKSGYAEDYIRNQFKKKTGKTPTQFLTQVRINRACYLINIYKNHCPMSQIAELCGFTDYIYFSRRFKQFVGISPNEYKRRM